MKCQRILAKTVVEIGVMDDSGIGASIRAEASVTDGAIPPDWIGARDLPTLTLHLRGIGGDARMALGELAELLFAIDDESQGLIRADRSRFFEIATGGVARGEVVWTMARTFLEEIFMALSDLVLRDGYAGDQGVLSTAGRAELMARTLRAGAGVVCWDAFRYGPFDEAGWARLGHVFSLAVEADCADREVDLLGGAGAVIQTTPRRAFVHAVAVRCAGFDCLPVEWMGRVEDLIASVSKKLSLRGGDAAQALFWLHLGEGAGPRRLLRDTETDPNAWYFAPGPALCDLHDKTGPAGAGVAHLRHQWSVQQPFRRHQRFEVNGSLGVVQQWEAVLASLSGKMAGTKNEFELGDISRSGLSVRAPANEVASARVGDLMGLWLEGDADCQLGVVRRIERKSSQSVRLGIEIFTRTPTLVEVDDGQTAAVGVACDPVRPGSAVRFLAHPDSLNEGEPVFLKLGPTVLKLRPLGRTIRARSCQLQTFHVM